MVGDLAHGRTVRSLAYLLSMYDNVKVYFVAPEVVRMKDDIKQFLTSKNVDWEEVWRWCLSVCLFVHAPRLCKSVHVLAAVLFTKLQHCTESC